MLIAQMFQVRDDAPLAKNHFCLPASRPPGGLTAVPVPAVVAAEEGLVLPLVVIFLSAFFEAVCTEDEVAAEVEEADADADADGGPGGG